MAQVALVQASPCTIRRNIVDLQHLQTSVGIIFARLFALAILLSGAGAVPGGGGLLSGILNSHSCHGDSHDNASGSCHAASALHPGVHSVDATSFAAFFPEVTADVHAHDQFLPDVGHANLADATDMGTVLKKPRPLPAAFNEK